MHLYCASSAESGWTVDTNSRFVPCSLLVVSSVTLQPSHITSVQPSSAHLNCASSAESGWTVDTTSRFVPFSLLIVSSVTLQPSPVQQVQFSAVRGSPVRSHLRDGFQVSTTPNMVTYKSTQFVQFGLVQLRSVQRSATQLRTFPFSSVQPSSVQPSRAIQFSPAKCSSFLLSAVRTLNCEALS